MQVASNPVSTNTQGVRDMGKYVLAWLLGVPGIVLIVVYFLFN